MANEQEILLPDIGGFEAVEVIEISVAQGDQVATEDTLITLESDKATMDIPSPSAGTVKDIKVSVGDTISEGTPIVILEENDVNDQEPLKKAPEQKQKNEQNPNTDNTPELPIASETNSGNVPSSSKQLEGAPRPAPSTPDGAQLVGASHSAKAHASPSVRRFARELGIDLGLVRGCGRKDRILKEDVKAFTRY